MENVTIAELFTGFVYEIRCGYTNQVYYGSTKNFRQRIYQHKNSSNTTARNIIERGNYTAKIIETIFYKDKKELLTREKYYIQNYECVNKQIPIINKIDLKEHVAELARKWYLAHRASQIKKADEYQKNNKEKHNLAMARYYKKNRDRIGKYQRERREKQFNELQIKIYNPTQL